LDWAILPAVMQKNIYRMGDFSAFAGGGGAGLDAPPSRRARRAKASPM
jgi:hypothetical protein